MASQSKLPEPIRRSIGVSWNQQAAFERFTTQFGEWWPRYSHSIGGRRVKRVIFECRVGGLIYEEHQDGTRMLWGMVTAFDAPHRVAFTFHPSRDESDAQSIDVRFRPDGAGTRVELTSSGWEKVSKTAQRAYGAYRLNWGAALDRFAGRFSGVVALFSVMSAGIDLIGQRGTFIRNSHGRMSALLALTLVAVSSARALAQGRRGAPITLPDGPGRDIVQSVCAQCHSLALITNDGYSREEWPRVFGTMIELPNEQRAIVVDYLARHFPEKAKPPAVLIAGPANVSFTEWAVPTKGSRPHDPLATADGALWYTGQFANKLGRVDTKTGNITEFPLPTPASGPHGLVADKEGDIWFTANSKGYIGKLDPRTGRVAEYRLPDGARDPHTPIFDQKGILWFTVQGANMIGRLDPKTGDVKVVSSPTPRSNPYGMVVSSTGTPFFVEFGTNKIAGIDPTTMAIQEWALPNGATRPRRVAIDDNDILWYSDYSRGYLGRFDPKTGQAREWPSPGGPKSQPYAITFSRGAIWYVESAVKPNALVRFDPKAETFQTWAIPGGGGVVRNMMPTIEGNLVLAESGLNMVALAKIAR